MAHRLHDNWQQVLAERGNSVALIDAESGRSWRFCDIEQRACEWLSSHASLQQSEGKIWCLALSDRTAWLSVFLAAIKAGAVVLPLEPAGSATLRDQANARGAYCLIHDSGLDDFVGSSTRPGCFLVKLTSGTTGALKALPFTEYEMIADGTQIMRSMSISARDRNYAIIPLGHSYGLGNLVMPFFMEGVPMVLASSPYPQVMIEELTRFPCTILPLVPPLVKALAMTSLESKGLPGLRLVISAGSALTLKFAQRFYENTGLRVQNFYGSSETGGICFDRSGELSQMDGAVGPAIDGVELSVMQDLSIRVRSDAVCHALYPEGICMLHDYGRLDAGGNLHLIGRHSDLVKIAGRRVSLSELESVICGLNGVTDAFVSTREGRSGERRCVAIYTGSIEPGVVRGMLKSDLAAWKVPKHLWRIDTIPHTARGKKDRKQLEELIQERFVEYVIK